MSSSVNLVDNGLAGDVASLLELMANQAALCERLLHLAEAERTALLQNRVEPLEAAIQEKSSLVEQMERLERDRAALCDRLAPRVGVSVGCSLVDLAGAISGQGKDDLLALRDQISDSAAALGEVSESNMRLMQKSLELVRDSLRQIRRLQGSGDVYTSRGEAVASTRARLAVDRQA